MSSQAAVMNQTQMNYRERTPVTVKQAVYWAVTAISCLSALYLLSVIITGAVWLPIAQNMSSSDITLSLLECALGLGALHIPAIVAKTARIKIPDALCVVFYLFILCATVLGEVFSFYYTFTYWDCVLHFSSGVMLGMLGSILLLNLLQKKKCESLISPALAAAAAVCLALCVGVVWEFYEFAADNLFGLNMQKCLLQDGTALMGKAAIMDTMKDLLVDCLGGTTAAVLAFRSLKHQKGWLSFYQNGGTEPDVNTLPDNGYTEPRAA